jgi:hypothetical protein
VPNLNLQPNTRGGTAKKITSSLYSSLYRHFVEASQKKKINQATKSKTKRLASNALLGPSKRQKRRVCRDPTPSDIPPDSDIDLAVPFADESTEEEEQDADCVFCTGRFSLRPQWRRVDLMCETSQIGAHTLFVSLVMDKHCFVLSLYPLYL